MMLKRRVIVEIEEEKIFAERENSRKKEVGKREWKGRKTKKENQRRREGKGQICHMPGENTKQKVYLHTVHSSRT
jgi:hypothetical protein